MTRVRVIVLLATLGLLLAAGAAVEGWAHPCWACEGKLCNSNAECGEPCVCAAPFVKHCVSLQPLAAP